MPLAVLNDAVNELTETLTLTLTSATGGATLGASTAAVTIIADDDAVSFALAPLAVAVAENAGTAPVSVTTTGTAGRPVSVTWLTVDGTAVAGTDYTLASRVLTWTAGQTGAKADTVAILSDAILDDHHGQ
jgi:hypothetical protein